MARVSVEKVEKEVTYKKQVTRYVLTLSELEAETLLALTYHVRGLHDDTFRGVTDRIQYALSDAGLHLCRDSYFSGAVQAAAFPPGMTDEDAD